MTDAGPRIASERNAGRVAVLALLVASSVLAFHALAVAPSTDDFCNRLAATAQSLPAAVADAYRNWTGRIVTTTLLYAALRTFDLVTLWPIALALVAAFVASAHAIAKLACTDDGLLQPVVAAFALASMMIGLHGLVGQTLFWTTGGLVYTIALLLLLAWLASMRTLAFRGATGSGRIGGFAFGLVVGNAIELAVPIALAYGVTVLWMRRATLALPARAVAQWRLAGVVAGAALLAFAPGNRRRAQATATLFDFDASSLGQLGSAVANLLAQGSRMIIVAGLLAGVSVLAAHGGRLDPVRRNESLALVAGALAGLLPVLLVPAQFSSRNLVFLLVSLLAAALLVSAPVLLRRRPGAPFAASIVALAMTLAISASYWESAREAWSLHERLAAQDRTLREAATRGEREAAVPPVGIPPRTVHFIELASDASRWDNRCVARYYGLERVWRTGPDR